jgi:hypothetical protein
MGCVKKLDAWSIKKSSDHHGTDNGDILDRAVTGSGFCFADFVNDIHTLDYFPEYGVFGIEVVVVNKVDKELAPPGIGAGVCHGDRTPCIPVAVRKLILDYVPGPAHSGAGRVAALDHKTIDDPVEDYTVVKAFLHERFKVSCGDGHGRIERNSDIPHVRLELYQFLRFGRWCHSYYPGRCCGLICRWSGLCAPCTENKTCNKES